MDKKKDFNLARTEHDPILIDSLGNQVTDLANYLHLNMRSDGSILVSKRKEPIESLSSEYLRLLFSRLISQKYTKADVRDLIDQMLIAGPDEIDLSSIGKPVSSHVGKEITICLRGDLTGSIAAVISFFSDWEYYYNANQVMQELLSHDQAPSTLHLLLIIRAAEDKKLRDLVSPERRFKITKIKYSSPGICEGVGIVTEGAKASVGILKPIDEMINSKHERKKDNKYRSRQEEEEKELELERKRLENEQLRRDMNQIDIVNNITNLKSIIELFNSFEAVGVRGYDAQALISHLAIAPLIPFAAHIAEGRITGVEARDN